MESKGSTNSTHVPRQQRRYKLSYIQPMSRSCWCFHRNLPRRRQCTNPSWGCNSSAAHSLHIGPSQQAACMRLVEKISTSLWYSSNSSMRGKHAHYYSTLQTVQWGENTHIIMVLSNMTMWRKYKRYYGILQR